MVLVTCIVRRRKWSVMYPNRVRMICTMTSRDVKASMTVNLTPFNTVGFASYPTSKLP